MSKPTPQELAKQGNARAIAANMNRWLQPKGITATAKREDSCLQLTLKAERVPNPQVLEAFIRKVLASMEVPSIQTVKISVHLTGESSPVWLDEIELRPQAQVPEAVSGETALDENSSPAPEVMLSKTAVAAPEETQAVQESEAETAVAAPVETQAVQEYASDETLQEYASDETLASERVSASIADRAPQDSMDVETRSHQLRWLTTKRGKLLAILSIYVVVLAILGINFYRQSSSTTQSPPTPAPQPPKSNPIPTASATPGPDATVPSPPANPFKEAVKKAIAAANQTQTAQSQADWQAVVVQWQEAIALMQAVPQSSPNYQLAQQKVGEYQRNLNYGQQKAASSR